MSEESLELPQVQEAFRKAQEEFTKIARSAKELDSVSDQLTDAKVVVIDAGTKLAELANRSSDVASRLVAATEAIEKTDPAEIQARLRELDAGLARVSERLDASAADLSSFREESVHARSAAQTAFETLNGRVRLLTYTAIGSLVLVAAVLVAVIVR